MPYQHAYRQRFWVMRGVAGLLFAVALCCDVQSGESMVIVPQDDSTRVEVQTGSPIGRIALWAPEAIMSERGVCALYPKGAAWRQQGKCWTQSVGSQQAYGPGNYLPTDGEAIDLVGFTIPLDEPVEWTTRLSPGQQRLDIEIRVRNVGTLPIRRAGAAVCIKFIDAGWWSDATTLALSNGAVASLETLGRVAGPDNGFEAYLLHGEDFANPFYVGFWGFNPRRLDRSILVSKHSAAGCAAVVSTERAYFMHTNGGNPCTDTMLALGDLAPGSETVVNAAVSITSLDSLRQLFNESNR